MDFVTIFTDALQDAFTEFQGMLTQIIAFLPQFVAGLIVFALGFLAAQLIRRWGRRVARNVQAPQTVEKLIVTAAYIVGLLGAVTLALAAMGVQIYPLVTGLGVSGLIVGFALKDILENLMAGALLLIQQPFSLGDHIMVDGVEGHVTRIQIRSTTIKTLDNLEVIVPNLTIYTNNITNYNTYPHRRWALNLGIGYGEDLPRAMSLILDTVNSIDGVSADPEPYLLLNDFGDSAVQGKLYYYIDQTQHNLVDVRTRVTRAIERRVMDENINLPYPTSIVINKTAEE